MPDLRLAGLASAGVGFLALARDRLAGLDQGLLDLFAALRGPVLDGLFQAVTWLGSGYLLAPVVLGLVAWLIARRQGLAAWLLAMTYFGAALTTWALKQAIGRLRPDQHPALADFIGVDWSFPSGHTTHAAALALGLWACLPVRQPWARRILASVLAGGVCLVATSRLYLQVHWPSDVLAGLLVALAWAGLAAASATAIQGRQA
ncbi:MAG: phosphatase PAP2 family protein [Pseudomonadota bacterium]